MTERPRQQSPSLPPITHRNWERCDVAGPLAPLYGRRLIVVNETGSHHDYRAWSEPVMDAGALVVWVVTDEQWWRYRHLAMTPKPVRWPAAAAWVEEA